MGALGPTSPPCAHLPICPSATSSPIPSRPRDTHPSASSLRPWGHTCHPPCARGAQPHPDTHPRAHTRKAAEHICALTHRRTHTGSPHRHHEGTSVPRSPPPCTRGRVPMSRAEGARWGCGSPRLASHRHTEKWVRTLSLSHPRFPAATLALHPHPSTSSGSVSPSAFPRDTSCSGAGAQPETVADGTWRLKHLLGPEPPPGAQPRGTAAEPRARGQGRLPSPALHSLREGRRAGGGATAGATELPRRCPPLTLPEHRPRAGAVYSGRTQPLHGSTVGRGRVESQEAEPLGRSPRRDPRPPPHSVPPEHIVWAAALGSSPQPAAGGCGLGDGKLRWPG